MNAATINTVHIFSSSASRILLVRLQVCKYLKAVSYFYAGSSSQSLHAQVQHIRKHKLLSSAAEPQEAAALLKEHKRLLTSVSAEHRSITAEQTTLLTPVVIHQIQGAFI